MKRQTLSLLLLSWLSGAALPVQASSPSSPSAVLVSPPELFRESGVLRVSFSLDLSGVSLGRDRQAVYRPLLVSHDGRDSLALGPVVVNGRNASIREQRLPKTRVDGAVQTVRRHNGTPQTVSYAVSVPYGSWMEHCRLYLSEDLCGCGDVTPGSRRELCTFDNRPVDLSLAVAALSEPQAEASKLRHEKGRASVDFPVNKTAVRADYRGNRAEIGKIVSTIDVVRNNRNVEITSVEIHGYASPEGSYAHNAYLASHRTQSLTAYVRGLYDLPRDLFRMSSTAEDWDGLRALVSGSDLPSRESLLSIIDDASLDADAREARIKSEHPEDYAFMLREWYPGLRHSDYTVSYVVRPYTAEEALDVMRRAPHEVSVQEMYRASQLLPEGSSEQSSALLLAASTYPDDATANYNAAVASLRLGDYAGAERYASRSGSGAGTDNVLGIVALSRGDHAAAAGYFRRAAAQGLSEASANLSLAVRMEQLSRQNR